MPPKAPFIFAFAMFAAVTFVSLCMFVIWPMLTTGKMVRQPAVGGPFTLI